MRINDPIEYGRNFKGIRKDLPNTATMMSAFH